MSSAYQYILFNKPYGVVSQFTREGSWKSLKDFGPFPASVYPVGRLDADSEGLLLLTDDTKARHRLTEPAYDHPKTYLVQVEGNPDPEALSRLRSGVDLRGQRTKPAEVHALDVEPELPRRDIPIRFRKNIPTSWLEITVREGKNRQVRRMTAAVGFPTLRLVRTKIGPLDIGELGPGHFRNLTSDEERRLLETLGLG